MTTRDIAFDLQIKLLMIGDSGMCSVRPISWECSSLLLPPVRKWMAYLRTALRHAAVSRNLRIWGWQLRLTLNLCEALTLISL